MNRTLSLKHLWWKDIRQLLPLIAILVLIGSGLHLFFALLFAMDRNLGHGSRAFLHVMVGLGMPALFAVGAGALIVGQEREQRTLDWLRSLPIRTSDILLTKLAIGLLGLLTIWLLSFLLASSAFLLQNLSYVNSASNDIQILPVVVNSFFLLAVGFTTAWLVRSAFISLLLVVPLAVLPMLATFTHDSLTFHSSSFYRTNPSLLFITYSVLFCVVFTVWAWRQGERVLGVDVVKPSRSGLLSAQSAARAAKLESIQAVTGVYPALLWQFARQNAIIILGLTGLLITTLLVLSFAMPNDRVVIPASIGAILATSWLGQLVFHSDSIDRRHLFLASRGVPVWQVWLSRQMIPLAILSGAATLVLLFARLPIQAWALTVGMLVLYAASQFLCQFLRSPILGVIVSPLFGCFCAAYLLFGSTATWLVLSTLVLFAGTYWQTRSWMDGRVSWRVAIHYLGWLLLALSLPLAPWLTVLTNLQPLPRQEYQRLEELSRQANADLRSPPGLALDVDPSKSTMQLVFDRFQAMPMGLPDDPLLNSLPSELLRRRLRVEQAEQVANTAPPAGLLTEYHLAVDVAAESARRLRMATTLSHQVTADKLEIAILEELRQPQSAERLGETRYAQLRLLLQDQAGRRRARQLAIGNEWFWLRRTSNGFSDAVYSWLIERPQIDTRYKNLLRLTEATTAAEREQIYNAIRAATDHPFEEEIPWQPTKLYLEDDDGQLQLLYSELLYNYAPYGIDWNGQWERLAAELQ
jgi:ABC-type transport system involved in multi-copper enzyme maturation permease subunit